MYNASSEMLHTPSGWGVQTFLSSIAWLLSRLRISACSISSATQSSFRDSKTCLVIRGEKCPKSYRYLRLLCSSRIYT